MAQRKSVPQLVYCFLDNSEDIRFAIGDYRQVIGQPAGGYHAGLPVQLGFAIYKSKDRYEQVDIRDCHDFERITI